MERFLKVIYSLSNVEDKQNIEKTLLDKKYENILNKIHQRLVLFNGVAKIVEFIGSIEQDELFDDMLNPYEPLFENQVYWNYGSLYNDITDFLHSMILENINNWGFNKEDIDFILQLEINGMFNSVVHNLTIDRFILISKYTIQKVA